MSWLPGFTTWPLLFGLAAAAIPFVLHLLSSVKAQEVYFPTLRFLRRSMEKTARRRRIQHWLLLLLRALLLAFLAISAAEPFTEATGDWSSGRSYDAVIIVDNSFSMMATRGDQAGRGADQADRTRLARARNEAARLLNGPNRPALATVMTTCRPHPENLPVETKDGKQRLALTTDHVKLRDAVTQVRVGFGPASLAKRVREACEILNDPKDRDSRRKSIYIFSDMQKAGFEKLANLKEIAAAKDVHLLIVDTSGTDKDRNLAVTGVEVGGEYVLNQEVTVRATLANSSATGQKYQAVLRVDGRDDVDTQTGMLGPRGQKTITFKRKLRLDRDGVVRGDVFLKTDSADVLPLDDIRRFSLDVAGRVSVLVVAGPIQPGTPPELGPAAMLTMALDPFGDQSPTPWSVAPTVVAADEFARSDLAGMDAAFFCNVRSFTPDQARAMLDFALSGGTVVIFPGPDTDAANYNLRLVTERGKTPLMPGKLGEAVGQVGPTADAKRVDWVDTTHPYLAGLHDEMSDYLGIRVQRYFRLVKGSRGGRTLLRLAAEAGDDQHDSLLIADRCGAGRIVLCTTTASRRWTNFPVTNLFLPAVVRISLHARRNAGTNNTHVAGKPVRIRPPTVKSGVSAIAAGTEIEVIPPMARDRTKPDQPPPSFEKTTEGLMATVTDTNQLGVYRWRPVAGGAEDSGGQFVVNPYGPESRLQTIGSDDFRNALADKGVNRVYVTEGVDAATTAALADTKRSTWWDIVLAVAIVLLVVEALVANRQRRRQSDESIPAHLNPRMASGRGSLQVNSGHPGGAA